MIYTSRYQNRELKEHPEEYTVVGVTRSLPKFPLGYKLAGNIIQIAPPGYLFNEYDRGRFTIPYFKHLDKTGVTLINSILKDYQLAGKPVVLCCYEDVRKEGEWCHRLVFAEWYYQRTGIVIPELKDPSESKLNPLECGMLPRDYVITEKSKIQLTQVERAEAQYYRQLWTHNFVGASAPINMAVLIDGMIAGVFGIDKSALTMGAFGTQVSDAVFLMYGMTVPHKTYRLGRLLTMIAQNKPFIMNMCTDLEKEKAKSLKTVQMTKHPEAKEMRGLMTLTKKVEDARHGYKLTYESPLVDRNLKQALKEWLWREERWQKERQKTKSTTK